jgi:hypothetical protein
MSLGEVCEHGSLKRQCFRCELEHRLAISDAHLKAADALAKAAARFVSAWCDDEVTGDLNDQLCDALAAYERQRGRDVNEKARKG